MAYLQQHKTLDHFMVSLVRDHERYQPIVQFLDNIIKQSLQLSWKDLELIGVEVASYLGADFCTKLRTEMSKALQITKLSESQLKVCKEFTRLLLENPVATTDDHINNLRQEGLTDQTIEDLICWVSMLQMYSVLDLAFGFDEQEPEILNQIAVGTKESNGYLASFKYFVRMINDQSASK